MLVYLCGPIDHCMDALKWRAEVKSMLISEKINVYDAATAFKIGDCTKSCDRLYEINRFALSQSDVVLANIFKIWTVGTIVELQDAKEGKIPVYAALKQDQCLEKSMILNALLKGQQVFNYIDEAASKLIADWKGSLIG